MKYPTLIILLLFSFLSCDKTALHSDEFTELDQDAAPTFPEADGALPSDLKLQIKNRTLNVSEAKVIQVDDPEGNVYDAYLVDKDMVLSKSALHAHQQDVHKHSRQAAHSYFVQGISNIRIYCSTSDPKISWAVTRAINNFNAISGVSLHFSRVPYPFMASIHVFKSNYAHPYGALGDVPDPDLADLLNGKIYPGRYVRVGLLVNTLAMDLIEHIITHEIAHALGLRHTDWWSGFSCGTFKPEAKPAWPQIWGTPLNDPSSILNQCWWPDTDGEFSHYDAVALQVLF